MTGLPAAVVLAAGSLWYVARASGTVSLLLLTASVLLGILSWSRWRTDSWPRFVTAGLHRNLSLLALAFVGLHVVVNVADDYVPIALADAVVPFGSGYRPPWLGFGAIAFDLLLLLTATSLLRRQLGWRSWRAVHWLAYACWPVALVHALGTGTDPRSGWFETVALVCTGSVLTVALIRIARARSAPRALRLALAAGGIAATVTVTTWAALGPLRPGWPA
jgi:DMSO/TMAO reductase YedYZ heme-binding membrane subunit